MTGPQRRGKTPTLLKGNGGGLR